VPTTEGFEIPKAHRIWSWRKQRFIYSKSIRGITTFVIQPHHNVETHFYNSFSLHASLGIDTALGHVPPKSYN